MLKPFFFVELNKTKKAIGFLDVALYMWHINNWPRLEFACDQLTANEKRLFNKLTPKGVRGGCKKAFFLWAERPGSWDDFNEHPEWDPSGASWEARVA